MAAASEIHGPVKSNPAEDWTVVLPRRGKKKNTTTTFSHKFVTPKREKETQAWTPADIETDPDRESRLMQKMQICIQKLVGSDFCNSFLNQMRSPETLVKFLRVLGSEPQMEMVIYGIGSIDSFEPPRLQLALAILMKRSFDWVGGIQVFDPIISLTESRVLTSLGCEVLSVNEQGRRPVVRPTLFFMPHCEVELYDNLLQANWGLDPLSRMVLFGNSFSEYEQQVSISGCALVSRQHVLAAKSFTDEIGVGNLSDYVFRAFHGSSWHFFRPGSLDCLRLDNL
ncbi:protein SENSITIVITY TO RED LIGHT REDUCED 1 [Striga asiatica]|uniref:Protein SENSITIVITY TO RED LIGHT REDUCED 1 n=1 Tax=Striga asiatica TaxID=4170 RepID=A0A5A7R8A5_STRAF|nr:protein SENSITIVITY TO RED LIGHT REDUCED 1 [Striga asiatica]